ncbi:MAG TPA: hypothetical protein VLQ78_13215 [Ornithinibacter sp.]|nr:hypothetical protein [Ornithinibacter sp.]
MPPHEVRAIGAPARQALANAGLTTWDAVDAGSDLDLLALHGFGPGALRILRGSRPSRPAGVGGRRTRAAARP